MPPDVQDRWDRLGGLAARGVDAGILAGAVLLLAVDLYLAIAVGEDGLEVPLLSASAVAAVALRRHLLVAATIGLAGLDLATTYLWRDGGLLLPSVAAIAALGLLALIAVRWAPPAAAAVVVAAASVALVGEAGRLRDRTDYLLIAVPIAVFLAGCVAAGAYLRWLDWQRERAAVDARRDERLDLARELHDLVAHYVTAMVVQAQGAQVVAAARPEVALDSLAAIERAGSDALAAMRRLVGSLRADGEALPAPAGSAGLNELVATSNSLGLPVRLRADDEVLASLPPAVAASTHRIVQESLTNARRHGHDVTAVDVVVDRVDGALQIVVHDDGRHTTRGRGEIGYGLVGMAERSAALGGTFTAGRDERGGWTVVATIPVDVAG